MYHQFLFWPSQPWKNYYFFVPESIWLQGICLSAQLQVSMTVTLNALNHYGQNFLVFFPKIMWHFCLLQVMEWRKYILLFLSITQNMTADKTSCACKIETTSTAHKIVLSWAEQFVVHILIMYSRCVIVCHISSLLTVK